MVEAFYAEEIGVGHALLLAKLQPAQQEQALANCFREEWNGAGAKAKRILLPVRHLQQWIEHNVLLLLKQAPFNKRDPQLVPAAGSCVDCPKRTGHNKLLFADVSGNSDACTDPNCYAAKLDAHVKAKVAAKPELVQISTAYKQQPEGEKTIPRNKYVEIREEKPDTPEKAKWPEFKTCKYTTEAIVSDGIDKGELRKVCTEPTCPVHHPKKQTPKADASFKAEQEKRRREEALANATGIRVLQSIVAAVPVRLMKRDLLFVAEQLLPLLDEKRLEMVARNRSIKAKEGESVGQAANRFRPQGRRRHNRQADCRSCDSALRQITGRRRQGSPRRRPGLRGRYRRRGPQGQAGVRREGEGEEGHEAGAEASGEGKASRLANRESLDLPSGRSIFWSRPSSHPESCSRIRESAMFCPPDGLAFVSRVDVHRTLSGPHTIKAVIQGHTDA